MEILKIKDTLAGCFRKVSLAFNHVKTQMLEQMQSFGTLLKVSRKEFPSSRPYLTEAVIGQAGSFSAITWLILFLVVVFIMAWSLLPILGTTFGLGSHPNIPEEKPGIGKVVDSDHGDIEEGITFSSPFEPYLPSESPGGEEAITETDISGTDPDGDGVRNDFGEEERQETDIQEAEEEVYSETSREQKEILPMISIGSGYCEGCARYQVNGRFTHYWPNNYPSEYEKINGSNLVTTMNCWGYNLVSQECESKLASDLPWKAFVGLAVACPLEYPLGTRVKIPALGREYICLDRGSMLCSGGVCDFDILAESIPFDGEVFETIIEVPGW